MSGANIGGGAAWGWMPQRENSKNGQGGNMRIASPTAIHFSASFKAYFLACSVYADQSPSAGAVGKSSRSVHQARWKIVSRSCHVRP